MSLLPSYLPPPGILSVPRLSHQRSVTVVTAPAYDLSGFISTTGTAARWARWGRAEGTYWSAQVSVSLRFHLPDMVAIWKGQEEGCHLRVDASAETMAADIPAWAGQGWHSGHQGLAGPHRAWPAVAWHHDSEGAHATVPGLLPPWPPALAPASQPHHERLCLGSPEAAPRAAGDPDSPEPMSPLLTTHQPPYVLGAEFGASEVPAPAQRTDREVRRALLCRLLPPRDTEMQNTWYF